MNTVIHEQQLSFLADKLQGKTILVNGATGLIGSRIVRFLLDLNNKKGASVTILCSYRNEQKKNLIYSDVLSSNDLHFLLSPESGVPEFNGHIDYTIQAAGISGGTKMHLKDPLKVFDASLYATRSLLDFSLAHGASKFLFVSTYEIYGSVNSETPVKEDIPCNLDTFVLRNIYAECKRACESLCTAYCSHYGIETFSGRLTSTFGSGVKYDDPRFFAEFARCVIENHDIVLKSAGGTVRNYLDADDAASGFLYILACGEKCNAYNLTNMSNAISIRDIAKKIIEVAKADVKLKFDLTDDITKLGFRKEGCTLMDSTKLESLGWKPVYSFEETLQKLLDSMQNNRIS